jgi:2-amino-4-hydroxy-6-hydroxymethyldihydropteridine diphosphokinase
MPRCHIALGGNVGDVARSLGDALSRLADTPDVTVVRTSSIFQTRPVGPRAGQEFGNAAAEIETSLPPLALLDVLQDVERQAGRIRGEHWGPRPLDLDLIFYADQIVKNERLHVPHPACWYRRFVLDPLAAIAADVLHPCKGLTVGELRSRLLARPLRLQLAGSTRFEREGLTRILAGSTVEIEVSPWQATIPVPGEPTIVAWLGPGDESDTNTLRYEDLPTIPRLDASAALDPAEFLRGVLQSALG